MSEERERVSKRLRKSCKFIRKNLSADHLRNSLILGACQEWSLGKGKLRKLLLLIVKELYDERQERLERLCRGGHQ